MWLTKKPPGLNPQSEITLNNSGQLGLKGLSKIITCCREPVINFCWDKREILAGIFLKKGLR